MGCGYPTVVWQPVTTFPGFEASNSGEIRSVRVRILSQYVHIDGFRHVNLRRDGCPANSSVHRLVAQAFLGPIPPGHKIIFLDGDRLNVNANNLLYAPFKRTRTM